MSVKWSGPEPRSQKPWSDEDRERAWELRNQGLTYQQIAEKIYRTRDAVSFFFHAARVGPERVKSYQENSRRTPREKTILSSRPLDHECAVIHRPTPQMLADRDKRLALPPRDLTGAMFGDPPLGLSALERR